MAAVKVFLACGWETALGVELREGTKIVEATLGKGSEMEAGIGEATKGTDSLGDTIS